MGKERKPSAWDGVTKWVSIIACLINLVCLVPQLPWRIAAVDANMGGRFSVTRHYSPFSATNSRQQITSWFKLKREICTMVRDMNTPNPIGMVITVATAATSTGGALGGCFTWQPCKDAAATRCWTYGMFAIVGILTMLLMLISAICSACVPVCMGQELGIKKKKARAEAMFKTQVLAIVAFALDFLGVMMWIGATESGFRTVKTGSYYPWPSIFIGTGVAIFGILLTLLAMIGGIMRTREPEKEEEEQPMEEYAETEPAPMGPPMGMPPPYDPFGPPPPMGMPPMGMGPPPPFAGPPSAQF